MNLEGTLNEIIKSAIGEILTAADFTAERKLTFSDIVFEVKQTLNKMGCGLLSLIYSAFEHDFDKTRDKHRIVVRNRNKTRNLLTEFGNVRLQHTLYYDKIEQKYFFATDEILKIEKYCRIENGLQAKLVADATVSSFGKASSLSDHAVSRQTVFNLVKRLKTIDAPEPPTNRHIKDIYIEADEDHIHLQDGKNAEVKLVYVHEGRQKEDGRSSLINPRYFVSVDDDIDCLWNDVAKYVFNGYNVVRSHVHLSGDGASWIKAGQQFFPNAHYHLDKFHVQRALISISNGNKPAFKRLRKSVYEGATQEFLSQAKKIYDAHSISSKKRTIYQAAQYVWSNFDCINRENLCCAEGHVSHVLSARMSSRPMAWSRAGAERIAKLRAYMYNKGDFRQLMICGKNNTKENLFYSEAHDRLRFKDTPLWENTTYSIPGIEKISSGFASLISKVIK